MQPQLELRDIHLPDAIGWWPPAIGWWILAILIPLTCWFIFWLYKRITRKTAIKTAKKILLNIQNKDESNADKLIALSELIRRVAISVSPRSETASLTGKTWLQHLDSSVKGTPFSSGAGQVLADAQYQKTIAADLDMHSVINVCEDWLNAQKQPKK